MKQVRPTLTPELHEWLLAYAKLTDRSCASIMRIALTQYRDRHARLFAKLQAKEQETKGE